MPARSMTQSHRPARSGRREFILDQLQDAFHIGIGQGSRSGFAFAHMATLTR